MKTFNVWKYDEKCKLPPKGPWVFMCAVLAIDENHAINIGRMRFGLDGEYQVYLGVDEVQP